MNRSAYRAYIVAFKLFCMLLGLCCLCLEAEADRADHVRHEIFSFTSTEPIASAYGMVLFETGKGASEDIKGGGLFNAVTKPATARAIGEGRWEVTVELAETDYLANTKITAVALTESGKALPSPVRWLKETDALVASAPACSTNVDSFSTAKLLKLQEDALQALIRIRKEKVGTGRKKLSELLTPERLDFLNKLEGRLNLTYNEPLSLQTKVDELAFRLGIIQSLKAARNAAER